MDFPYGLCRHGFTNTLGFLEDPVFFCRARIDKLIHTYTHIIHHMDMWTLRVPGFVRAQLDINVSTTAMFKILYRRIVAFHG